MYFANQSITVVSALAHAPREAEKTCANADRALTWCHLKSHIYVIWRQSCEVCVVPLFIRDLLSVLDGSKKLNAVESKREILILFTGIQIHSVRHFCFIYVSKSNVLISHFFVVRLSQALSLFLSIDPEKSEQWIKSDDNNNYKYM